MRSKQNTKPKVVEIDSETIDDSDFYTIDTDDTDNSSDDETIGSSDTETDETEISEKEEKYSNKQIRSIISEIFPSRYMKERVEKDNEKSTKTKSLKHKKENTKSKKENTKSKKENIKSKKTKKNKKSKNETDEEDEEEYNADEDDEDYTEDEDEEPTEKNNKKNINIIFEYGGGGLGGGLDDDEIMEEQNALLDEEDCDSDDEKTFMKETYENIIVPEPIKTALPKTKKEKQMAKQKQKQTTAKAIENDKIEHDKNNFENEYNELVDTKKYFIDKLKKNPKSKTLLNSLKSCDDDIKKLVKKMRGTNTKTYHKMINSGERKFTSEIEFFKKKLSNQEQQKVMNDLKEINEYIQINKPYRLSLLETNIPSKYKATILQKINILQMMEPGDPEYYKMKTYIDTFMRIPIGIYKSLNVTITDGVEKCNEFMENSMKILDDCVYGLNDSKMQILQMVGQWISNPSAMGTAIAIHGPMGSGKCLGVDTPILMFDGSIKKVQDVVVGDVIMGDDSTERKILSLGTGTDTMYDIIINDTDKYTVNSEHILCLKLSKRIKPYEMITLQLYLNLREINKKSVIEIPINIYEQLPEHLKPLLLGYKTAIQFSSKTYSIHPLKYNFKNKQNIPNEYKINSSNIQFPVLANIIYNFGRYNKNTNTFEITHSILQFTQDILFISRSLGFDANYVFAESNNKYYYDITIQGKTDLINQLNNHINVFTTHNPLKYLYDNIINFTKINEIQPMMEMKNDEKLYEKLMSPIQVVKKEKDTYYGFEIDGNRRFVLGNFTVTHNTSLIKDGISKILGREFAFIALGGAGDSSFLEGHSYAYEGSSWGQILKILIDSKCMNPVIYFDELDKVSDSPRGNEIIGILTHLTDTSQNCEFHDKYFSEMGFDLSKCLFIFSYNDESKVNPILKDRMYRIQTKGYNTKEKIIIAKNYILPKIREQVNFKEGDIIIPDETLEYIITKPSFTKSEEGVRNLKRCLEIIYTKLNLYRLIKPDAKILTTDIKLKVSFPFTVSKQHVNLLIKEDETINQSMFSMYI